MIELSSEEKKMRKIDYHMHTRFSLDSEANPHDHVRKAIQMGLAEICFTDHYDVDYPGQDFTMNLENYYQYMLQLKKQYEDQIKIKIGIEMGLDPIHAKKINRLIRACPFDFVIGSIHAVRDTEFFAPGDFFNGLSKEEAHHRYFEQAVACIKTFDNINVFGHYDYIERYGPYSNNQVDLSKYTDLIEQFLDILIHKGIGLEVNTSGFNLAFRQQGFPQKSILELYYHKGGRIITIGSDAHTSDRVGEHVDDVIKLLKVIGFNDVTTFTNQKADE